MRYPKYGFCGLKMATATAAISLHNKESSHFRLMCKNIDTMKKLGAVVGGMFLEYGIIENKERPLAEKLCESHLALIRNVRTAVGDSSLPAGIVKFCLNAPIKDGIEPYRANDSIVLDQLQQIQWREMYVFSLPAHFLPVTLYCDNHHENADGYFINALDAACTLQLNNYDFWNEEKK
jgi:hypothetical protein